MTRFARAKGSKASNEKAPEDATPWEVMKEQLLQAKKENEDVKKRQAAEQQRIENYESFLKDRRVQKRPASWCDFPEVEQNLKHKKIVVSGNTDGTGEEIKKYNKKKKDLNGDATTEIVANVGIPDCPETKKKKKKKNKQSSEQLEEDFSENSHQKKGKPKILAYLKIPQNTADSPQTEAKSHKKKKNKKQKRSVELMDNLNKNNDDADPSNTSLQAVEKNVKQNKKNKNKSNVQAGSQLDSHDSTMMINKEKTKKKKKLVDGKPVRRKEINDRSFQLIIGGKEVELVRYDGFPVMKKDGERLAELKDSMIKKGIPKSEVQRTMKLERRRAEKALARLRREVCYNCRKGGHNLSDCPELKSKIPGADAPEGVCFKCGSTEHRQFECKVQRDKEFRFATCFICKEPGHIARQCPDNPKGLYPNGGSCKLCGDVTHLRKDCHTASNKKESTSVKLQTLDSTEDLEGIGIQDKATTPSDSSKKPKKIKF